MIVYPIAKINLGLNVVEKRPDGYHNLETVFYPVPIKDALEVMPMDEGFPSDVDCDLKTTNIHIEGDEQKNLVVRAYRLLKEDFPTLPRCHRVRLINEEASLHYHGLCAIACKEVLYILHAFRIQPVYSASISAVEGPVGIDRHAYHIPFGTIVLQGIKVRHIQFRIIALIQMRNHHSLWEHRLHCIIACLKESGI